MDLKLINTGDNSPTFYNPKLDEHYHSTHGAYQESVHVYIEMGLKYFVNPTNIKVFEMGFGTGLNVLLAWMFAHEKGVSIDLTTVELYPLQKKDWNELTYASTDMEKDIFEKLHSCNWEEKIRMDEKFSFRKYNVGLMDFQTESKFNIIFYDAFGPRVQPELWELSVFEKLYGMLELGGAVVTYSAKGQVRRNMVEAGFYVERLSGPPGKREMLRAVKR